MSCVRFSPNVLNPVIVSCGWDKVVKVRVINFTLLPHSSLRMMLSLYICYFRGPSTQWDNIFHQDLWRFIIGLNTQNLRTNLLSTGLGTLQVQVEDQPLRTYRLHQHCVRFSRWFPRRLWWQRRHHHALGPQRGQAPLFARGRGCCQCPCLLAQPILAMRRNRQLRQDLRSGEQVSPIVAPLVDCPSSMNQVYRWWTQASLYWC